MIYLVLVSLLWAFSFSLIKGRLAGLDPSAIAVVRLGLAALMFIPWLRPRGLGTPFTLRLLAIGGVQFGLMYVCYLAAFAHLAAYEVAMFTIFTPLYVALFDGALEHRWPRRALAAAALAVLGAAALKWDRGLSPDGLLGFLLVQGSNLAFAAGQVAYRRLRLTSALPAGRNDAHIFALPYLGGVGGALIFSLFATTWADFNPTDAQWLTLLYLGVIASGLGFFGWNLGATRSSSGTLAVANNLVVPLAVIVALVFFGEQADLPRLFISAILLSAALALVEWPKKRPPDKAASKSA